MSASKKAVGSSSKAAYDVFDSFDFRTPKPMPPSTIVFGTPLETVPVEESPRVEFRKRQRWSALSAFSRASALRPKDERDNAKEASPREEDEPILCGDDEKRTSPNDEAEQFTNKEISVPEEAARPSGISGSSDGATLEQRREERHSRHKKRSEEADIRPRKMARSIGTSSSSRAPTEDKSLDINVDPASSATSTRQPSKKESEDLPQQNDPSADVEAASVGEKWKPTKQEWFIMLSLSLISTVVALDSTILVTILPVSALIFFCLPENAFENWSSLLFPSCNTFEGFLRTSSYHLQSA